MSKIKQTALEFEQPLCYDAEFSYVNRDGEGKVFSIDGVTPRLLSVLIEELHIVNYFVQLKTSDNEKK